jgi:hypothetical protein
MGRGRCIVCLGQSIVMATVWLLKRSTQADAKDFCVYSIACPKTNGVQLLGSCTDWVDSGQNYVTFPI